jgi:hypothetical protein
MTAGSQHVFGVGTGMRFHVAQHVALMQAVHNAEKICHQLKELRDPILAMPAAYGTLWCCCRLVDLLAGSSPKQDRSENLIIRD